MKFSARGGFKIDWGSEGSGPGEFDLPHAIDLDAAGRVYGPSKLPRRATCRSSEQSTLFVAFEGSVDALPFADTKYVLECQVVLEAGRLWCQGCARWLEQAQEVALIDALL